MVFRPPWDLSFSRGWDTAGYGIVTAHGLRSRLTSFTRRSRFYSGGWYSGSHISQTWDLYGCLVHCIRFVLFVRCLSQSTLCAQKGKQACHNQRLVQIRFLVLFWYWLLSQLLLCCTLPLEHAASLLVLPQMCFLSYGVSCCS